MNAAEKEVYYKGYVSGYRMGMRDAMNGYSIDLEHICAGDIPVEAAELSTRVKNCLLFSGCKYLRDVVEFDGKKIRTMRNFGPKGAAEVARYLDSLGIYHSAWNAYL